MKKFLMIVVMALFAGPVMADAVATKAVNEVRASKNRSALAYSPRLERIAAAHAADMARGGFFSHSGSNGSTVGKRAKRGGYKWCWVAENIAKGQTSVAQVMGSWTNSSGHLKNIMHRKAREFGIARGAGNVWVMVLARPC